MISLENVTNVIISALTHSMCPFTLFHQQILPFHSINTAWVCFGGCFSRQLVRIFELLANNVRIFARITLLHLFVYGLYLVTQRGYFISAAFIATWEFFRDLVRAKVRTNVKLAHFWRFCHNFFLLIIHVYVDILWDF